MNKTKRIIVLIAAISILCVIGAATVTRLTTPPTFYKDDGGYDAAYIPLIEPYRVVKLLGGERAGIVHKWSIDLIVPASEKEIYYYSQIYDVTKIAVENRVVMAYSPYSEELTERERQIGQKILHWFVIIPDQKIEIGFETEEEFLGYLHTLGIENPTWIEPGVANQQFIWSGCLDWIPDCE